jgi:hypothetical protein
VTGSERDDSESFSPCYFSHFVHPLFCLSYFFLCSPRYGLSPFHSSVHRKRGVIVILVPFIPSFFMSCLLFFSLIYVVLFQDESDVDGLTHKPPDILATTSMSPFCAFFFFFSRFMSCCLRMSRI